MSLIYKWIEYFIYTFVNMPTYCCYHILEISNHLEFSNYKSGLLNCIDKFNGRFIAIGDQIETKEGDFNAKYLLMLEFDLYQNATEWYNSAEYRELRRKRSDFMRTKVIFFKGL